MAGTVESRLCDFIVHNLEWEGTAEELVGDSPLLLPEVLDSEELFSMVTFVEDEFGIEVDDEEITAESLRTVADVARLVESKLTVTPDSSSLSDTSAQG
jgi:acyl carrier protein